MQCETIGDATLYCGDARELDLGAVMDCVVSDPPYKLTSGGKTGVMGGKLSTDSYDNTGSIVQCDITWPEIMAVLWSHMTDGHTYVMANNREVFQAYIAAMDAGFHFHNQLVWDKGTGTPNRWYMKNCEFTLFLKKGAMKQINDCSSRQLIKCPNPLNSAHETEKPVALMQHYIRNSSVAGETVFDPFMGIGSTGVAAVTLGRRFVGCELLPKYFDIACQRLTDAMGAERDMFAA